MARPLPGKSLAQEDHREDIREGGVEGNDQAGGPGGDAGLAPTQEDVVEHRAD